MALLLDPTFLMTRRGQDWARRSADRLPSVWCSSAFIAATSRLEGPNLPTYRQPFSGWNRYQHLPDEMSANLRPIRGDPCVTASLWLDEFDPEDASVILDIWCGLADGHWLVARRLSTFDALVQAGVTLIVQGASDYRRAFAVATEGIPSDLASALDRRVRFLASAHLGPTADHAPTLSLYDSGRSGFR